MLIKNAGSAIMDQDKYFNERLDPQIKWYDEKSVANQKWFKRLQIIVISVSATIPFISGYIDESTLFLKIIIGALGLIIAAITSVLGLYKFQENWLEYRNTCESLRQEKYLFLTGVEPYNIEQAFPFFVQRVEDLMTQEQTKWSGLMRNSDNKTRDK